MASFQMLPLELNLLILEQLDFQSLPAAIQVIAQFCPVKIVPQSAERTTAIPKNGKQLFIGLAPEFFNRELRVRHFCKNAELLWIQVMAQHLSLNVKNPGESDVEAMLRLGRCSTHLERQTRDPCELDFFDVETILRRIKRSESRFSFSLGAFGSGRPTETMTAAYLLYNVALYIEKEIAQAFNDKKASVTSIIFRRFSKHVGVHLKPSFAQDNLENVRQLLIEFATLGCQSLFLSVFDKIPSESTVSVLAAALQEAITYVHVGMVKELLNKGADVNQKNRWGRTILSEACDRGHFEIVKCLIEHGADVTAQCEEGYTPLHRASGRDIIALLLQHGADVNQKNRWGKTLLSTACDAGNVAIVKFLLEQGADVNAQCGKGHTPLHLASVQGYAHIVVLLLQHGADVTARCEKGRTPLDMAVEQGYAHIIALLMQRDATLNVPAPPLHVGGLGGDLNSLRQHL